ncbi:hypothetical protein SSTU70S_05909 [Stutzerimonas stutzeri]
MENADPTPAVFLGCPPPIVIVCSPRWGASPDQGPRGQAGVRWPRLTSAVNLLNAASCSSRYRRYQPFGDARAHPAAGARARRDRHDHGRYLQLMQIPGSSGATGSTVPVPAPSKAWRRIQLPGHRAVAANRSAPQHPANSLRPPARFGKNSQSAPRPFDHPPPQAAGAPRDALQTAPPPRASRAGAGGAPAPRMPASCCLKAVSNLASTDVPPSSVWMSPCRIGVRPTGAGCRA